MKKSKCLLGMIGGIVFFFIGGFLIKQEWFEVNKAISGVLIGFGSGLFGACTAAYITFIIMKKHPETARQMEIEEKDERNIMISDKAKSKTYSLMQFVYIAILFTLVIINVNIIVTLIACAIFLFQSVIMLFYISKYSKEL